MYFLGLFHSFLPLRNPIGFGASDFLEAAIGGLAVLVVFTRSWSESFLRRLARKTSTCMGLLAVLVVVLRLAVLARCPVPTPSGSDDFSYVLLGDTLSHWRLSNAPHPLHQFFETIFVVQQPSYSSIYPLGQGLTLALGQIVFGSPWAGVLLSVALLCALCYWMLRAWTTPAWALAGGLLAVMEFGPLSPWMNSYWGGAVSGIAGCLVFGSLPRLRESGAIRNAVVLGAGIGLELLTRPFEAVLLVVSAVLYLTPVLAQSWNRRWVAASLIGLTPAVLLMLAQNKAVTGSWTMLPYVLSRYEYGVPTSFTLQANPIPHRVLTLPQEMDYRAQSAIHGGATDTPLTFLQRLEFRLRYSRFFFFAPLYLAAGVFVMGMRAWRFAWVLVALALFLFGSNFYPYFYPHYLAGVTCLCLLVSIKGLEWIARIRIRNLAVGEQASRLILVVCATQFLFWYGLHLLGNENLRPILRYETWDFINYGDPQGRVAINYALENSVGQQLVFVRYWPQHKFEEWVHNAADIDRSRLVWANDLGDAENRKLLNYFHDRQAWLLEPDAQPPRLTAYEGTSPISHR